MIRRIQMEVRNETENWLACAMQTLQIVTYNRQGRSKYPHMHLLQAEGQKVGQEPE
jgi:hypothetical protein